MKRALIFLFLALIAVPVVAFQQQGRKAASLDMDDLSPLNPPPSPKLFELSPGEYSPQDSGYSVRFPATPVSLSQRIRNNVGEVLIINSLTLIGNDIEYNVAYLDYPPTNNDPYRAYEGFKEGHIAKTGASLANEKEILLKDVAGREYIFKYDGFRQISHLYFVDTRMYILSVNVPDKKDKTKEVNQFFASFRLVPK
jgi:hypothetical protein